MSIFERDRTFREPVSKLTTFFMVAFHLGAIAALFFFSWTNLLLAAVLWWVCRKPAASACRITAC